MLINIDYRRPPRSAEDKKWLTNSELTSDYILFAINQAHPDGLDGQKRRIYGRLQRKLDDAIAENKDSVELEEAEKDLIKTTFAGATFAAHLAKYVNELEKEIAKFDKEEKKEEVTA